MVEREKCHDFLGFGDGTVENKNYIITASDIKSCVKE
jgi:hypothetical protein